MGLRIVETQNRLFWDSAGGAFFSTAEGQPDLILRLKDGLDNAEPSTNGIAASNLNRLAGIFDDAEYKKLAQRTADAFEAEIIEHPFLFPTLLNAVVVDKLGMSDYIIAGNDEDYVSRSLKELRLKVAPTRTIVRVGKGAKTEWLAKRKGLPFSAEQLSGESGVWICEGTTCRLVKMGFE
jgi:uncharacterized protein YyaL (SSP411 family)